MSINVYGIENKQVLPLRQADDKKKKHVNLLYLQDSQRQPWSLCVNQEPVASREFANY